MFRTETKLFVDLEVAQVRSISSFLRAMHHQGKTETSRIVELLLEVLEAGCVYLKLRSQDLQYAAIKE
jgi:hypothetical protein